MSRRFFNLFGHLLANHAPGTADFFTWLNASHYINLAQGLAAEALRQTTALTRIGTTLQLVPFHPLRDTDADRKAAWRSDGMMNRWYLDAALLGKYPADMLQIFSAFNLPLQPKDLERIFQPLDFIGVNHYTRAFVRHEPDLPPLDMVNDGDYRVPGAEYTEMGWEVYPNGVYEILTRLRDDYGNPQVYITENGGAFDDRLENGKVNDPRRIALLRSYLASVHRAIGEGCRVGGYFVWSFTDNFEWEHGYSKRFGLVYIDYSSQRRIPKQSAYWYRDVVGNNAVEI